MSGEHTNRLLPNNTGYKGIPADDDVSTPPEASAQDDVACSNNAFGFYLFLSILVAFVMVLGLAIFHW